MAVQFMYSNVIEISCFIVDNLLAALKIILFNLPNKKSFKILSHQFPSLFAYLSTYP